MPKRADPSRRPTEPAGDGPVAVFAALGLALVAARFVLPAESAHLGETLWIVPLWLGLAFLWALARHRFELPAASLDRGDWGVLLLAGGHVLAGALADGNRRAALNGVTEWIGVAIAVGLLRRWLADERRWQQFLAVVATAGVVLSGLGVWQYAVEYPALRAEVTELGSLEERRRSGTIDERQSARLRQLTIELGQLASEADPNIKFALRQRLMASTEPLGCFALANTLGGVLAVALLLLLGGAASEFGEPSSQRRVVRIIVPAVLVAFCLLLTKSRTAWIGLLAGATVWGVLAWRGSLLSQRSLKRAVLGAAAMIALVAGAWAAGALDRLVVLEAPKSLRYRIEYWTGAWGVICDHVLLGVGPGNFRQNYLRHKVAGSSEEILDPHNLFLDAWASGGLLALLGLLLVVGLAVARWRKLARKVAPGPASAEAPNRLVLLGGIGGIALVWLKLGLVDLQWDARLLALMAGWFVTVLFLPRLRVGPAAQIAGGIALGVHLLGAGGMSMPVVSTLLLLLGLGPAATPVAVPAQGSTLGAFSRPLATCVVLAGLLVFTLQWAVIPSLLANFNMNAALSVMRERGDAGTARRLLEDAIAADPLDPQPHVYLAQLSFDASRTRRINGAELATTAISELDRAIELDPENPKTYWLQAQWKLDRLQQYGDSAMIHDAIETAEAAAARDPQNAEVLATLAEACAGIRADEARATAARALELDALNLQLGHYDRLLSDATRAELRALAGAESVE